VQAMLHSRPRERPAPPLFGLHPRRSSSRIRRSHPCPRQQVR
jgi:hypothetical protein